MKIQEADAKSLLVAQGLPGPVWAVAHTPAEARAAAERYLAAGAGEGRDQGPGLVGGRGKAGGVKLAGSADEAEAVRERSWAWTSRASRSARSSSGRPPTSRASTTSAIILDRPAAADAHGIGRGRGRDRERRAKSAREDRRRHRTTRTRACWTSRRSASRCSADRQAGRRRPIIASKLVTPRAVRTTRPGRDQPAGRRRRDGRGDRRSTQDHPRRQRARPPPGPRGAARPGRGGPETRRRARRASPSSSSTARSAAWSTAPAWRWRRWTSSSATAASRPTSSTSAAARIRTRSPTRCASSWPTRRSSAILVNIFGGITRGDEVAHGLIEARAQQARDVPMVVRLVGTNAAEAREILPRRRTSTTAASLDEAARQGRRREPRRGSGGMSILVDTRHAARGPGHHRPRRRVPRRADARLRHERRRRRDPGQGRPDRPGGRCRSSTPSPRRSRAHRGEHVAHLRARPPAPPDAVMEAADAGHRSDLLHHRGHPGARHDPGGRDGPGARRAPDRPELPRRHVARPGQGRDHPGQHPSRGPRRRRQPLRARSPTRSSRR